MTRAPLRSVPRPPYRPSRRVSPKRERMVCDWKPETFAEKLDAFRWRHRILAGLGGVLALALLAVGCAFLTALYSGMIGWPIPRGPR